MSQQIKRATVDTSKFNKSLVLPYQLRLKDFEMAMQDVYDFLYDVNTYLLANNLTRLDDMLRPANLTGTMSDMLTDALAKHSRTLTVNLYHNGHPDLIVKGRYPMDSVKSADQGVEVKSTKKAGGAVDTHGGRDQTLCTFVYTVDNDRAKAAADRDPLTFREVYIGEVKVADFRNNARGPLGTKTSTLGGAGLQTYRDNWVYKDIPTKVSKRGSAGTWRA